MKAMRRQRRWSTNAKVTVGLVVVVVVLGLAALFLFTQRGGGSPAELVRADSHRLSSAGDGKVTVVEFLDFQCPSCGAAYPEAERILAEYDGRITFVVRNYPLPMHVHAQAGRSRRGAGQVQGDVRQVVPKPANVERRNRCPAGDL